MMTLLLSVALLGQKPEPLPPIVVRSQTVQGYVLVPVPIEAEGDEPKEPTASVKTTVTITPATPVVVVPNNPPRFIYGIMPGMPTTGFSYSEEIRTPGAVYTRQERVGPAPVVQMKRGLLGKYKIVR